MGEVKAVRKMIHFIDQLGIDYEGRKRKGRSDESRQEAFGPLVLVP